MMHVEILRMDLPDAPKVGCAQYDGETLRIAAVESGGLLQFVHAVDVLDAGVGIATWLADNLAELRRDAAHVHVCIRWGVSHDTDSPVEAGAVRVPVEATSKGPAEVIPIGSRT